MFFIFIFISCAIIAYEVIYYATNGNIPDFEMISLSFVLSFNIIGLITIFLLNFIEFSYKISIIELFITLPLGIFLRIKRNTANRISYLYFIPYFMIIPISLCMTNNIYFSRGNCVIANSTNQIQTALSLVSSIAYGDNHKFPFKTSFNQATFFNSITFFPINAALMVHNGYSLVFSFKFLAFVHIVGIFSSLTFLVRLFSNYVVATIISFFIFIFSMKESITTQVFTNIDHLCAYPLSIFAYCLAISGICNRFRRKGFFVLSAVISSLTFTGSIDIFYGTVISIYSIFIFTFPYQNFYSWQIVAQKIYIYTVIMVLSLFPQMTYLDVVDSRSLLINLHNKGYFRSFVKEFLIFFLVFILLSWISMKRTAPKVINCSILFSLLVSRLITVQYPYKNLIAIASFYSGAVASVSQLIANFFKSKRPYKVLIGLAIFIAIIFTGFTSNPFLIRNQKTELFNDQMKYAAKWAITNTNPSDVFFSENRNIDPFVILAGRKTPIGQTNLLEYSGGNVPQMKRNMNYIYRSIANPIVLKNYNIDYVSIITNSTFYFGQQVMQSEIFTHVFTHGNISVYKVLKEKLNM